MSKAKIITKEAALRMLKVEYNLGNDDMFNSKQGFTIVTRRGIEKIQAIEKIKVTYEIKSCSPDFCVFKAFAEKDDQSIETYASAKRGEYKVVEKTKYNGEKYKSNSLVGGSTDSWYVTEIAEKRALSRAVLKICDLYMHGFFGEDENQEDFETKSEVNKVTVDNIIDKII